MLAARTDAADSDRPTLLDGQFTCVVLDAHPPPPPSDAAVQDASGSTQAHAPQPPVSDDATKAAAAVVNRTSIVRDEGAVAAAVGAFVAARAAETAGA